MKNIYFYYPNQPYAELMNFYKAQMVIEGKEYATVEHYFQAVKATNENDHEFIRTSPTPKIAKERGRKITLRKDWESVKEMVMLKALKAKFTQHTKLKEVLLSTGDAKLHEDSPKDMYWGVKGKDRLGILLMIVREKLSNESN